MLALYNLKYIPVIKKIKYFEKQFESLDDSSLLLINQSLKKKYKKEKKLSKLIPESFALTQEIIYRCLNYKPYKNQIIGGLILTEGKIIDMKTGEGKSLTGVLAACLQALTGESVHIMTTNDYLARRDKEKMEKIFHKLGFSVGLIQSNMSREKKRINYSKDIVYMTASTIGFDFLSDNLILDKKDAILKSFHFCIIDEIDSILIDEAQNPLIISKKVKKNPYDQLKYLIAAAITKELDEEVHFLKNKRTKEIVLTDVGESYIKKILNISNLYDFKNPWIPFFKTALKVKCFYIKDNQYIIDNNNISIIDEYTGRTDPDKKWDTDIQCAVEAKENIETPFKTEIASSITYQTFFLQYSKISGMSGTAKKSEAEFKKIYKLDVKEIPLNKKNQRVDIVDFIFKNKVLKMIGITMMCKQISLTNRPLLIVTKSTSDSEILANLLIHNNLKCQLLNAKIKDHLIESDIISNAGKLKQITIATSMAGRGSDIILGGNLNHDVKRFLYKIFIEAKNQKFYSKKTLFEISKFSDNFKKIIKQILKNNYFLNISNEDLWSILQQETTNFKSININYLIKELLEKYNKEYMANRQKVIDSGGLIVIGAEKNISLRIDDQIRGRCGRQGEPGTTLFFSSLDDDIFIRYNDLKFQNELEKKIKIFTIANLRHTRRKINKIQDIIEQENYRSRKINLEYDTILTELREIVYFERSKILENNNIENLIVLNVVEYVDFLFNYLKNKNKSEIEIQIFFKNFFIKYLFLKNKNTIIKKIYKSIIDKKLSSTLARLFTKVQLSKNQKTKKYIKYILLQKIDLLWSTILNKEPLLREIVPWRSYGNKKSAAEYRKEIMKLFYTQKRKIMRKNFRVLIKFLFYIYS
uniref:Protein translocase subunit SecA n=1 Tax=Nitzschia sp. PL3-2 TaxID=2083271 RepID=A0A2Z5ZAV5_9STRA|nr:preprotein translocase subunit A [Nitzschia sp. PL3-2]